MGHRINERLMSASATLPVVTILLGRRVGQVGEIFPDPGMSLCSLYGKLDGIKGSRRVDLCNNEVEPNIGANRHRR
jgi:hypothetical protein